MKVNELVKKLNDLDPNSEVLFYAEDEEIAPKGYAHRVLDVVEVSQKKIRTNRVENGVVTISFENQPSSINWACVELTSDV